MNAEILGGNRHQASSVNEIGTFAVLRANRAISEKD